MGFIKDALIGIALYEGIQRWISHRRNGESRPPYRVILGGKVFQQETNDATIIANYRHHLDRPEMSSE